MTEAPPLSWIKTIHSTLIDAGAIPLSGYFPAFPWEQLSSHMASLLQTPELKISPRKTAFLQGNNITAGLGEEFYSVALNLTPLDGQAFWLMGKEDAAQLTALALTSSPSSKGLSSPKFQEGFYYYLGTHVVELIDELRAFDDLSLKIAKPETVAQEESLCIDVNIELPKQSLWGRLVCPAPFHQEIKTHFNTKLPPSLTSAFAKQLDVTLAVEIGGAQLSLSQWKGVDVGDFILLDRCTFDPEEQKGTAMLTLEQTPIFRTKIKDSSLKIVDYAIYSEEQYAMDPEIPDEEDEEEYEDEDIESEDLSEVESEEEEPAAEIKEEEPSDVSHLWSPQDTEAEKLISSKEIPLTLTVEVARLRINLEKLLQLSVGNVLELPVKPEQGVDVLIGGKKVAKAELVKLGEMLGVKILQLGD